MIADSFLRRSASRSLAVLAGCLLGLVAAPALALDLNAQWLDSSGYRVDVVQDGNQVLALTTEGPHSGPWKRAEGRVRGQTLRLEVEGSRFEGRISEAFDRVTWNSGAVWVRIPLSANPGDLMRRLQSAVAAEQPLEVASLLAFPIELSEPGGSRQIVDSSALQKELPTIFGKQARGDLAALEPYSVGRDWAAEQRQGTVQIGRSRLRIAGSCADAECPPGEAQCANCGSWTYRVTGIEVLPAGPESVAGLFDEVKRRLRAEKPEDVGALLHYPIAVRIDGQDYELSEPAHFDGFAGPVFDRTRDDLLDLGEDSIGKDGRVRVRNGVFTLASSCTGETALECAEGDRRCEKQRREEQCRKREPRVTGVEIFSERQYTQKVAELRADLMASGAARSGAKATAVRDHQGTGRWLFLSSSEERPASVVDGARIAVLGYGDAPAGPHKGGSLRDGAQAAAFEFPALSANTLLDGQANPDSKRGEVAVHPGPLELEEGQPRPYLVIRWISGSSLRFARITAVLRRANTSGDGVTVTAASPDGRDAQALMRRTGERELSFELDEIRAGQWTDLAIGPRGSNDNDMLLVSMRVEAIEVGAPDPEATRRAVAAILGTGAAATARPAN